jgi:hypothetical protein
METITRRGFLRTAVLLAACVLSLPQLPLRGAENLPARLSDEAFWQIVTEFSEPSGNFISENFVSNERGYQHLIPKLQAVVQPGGVYLGVGPEQNYQYIAALKPAMAFIVDIRRQNLIQHLMYKAAFELSADRADFLSRIFSRRRPDGLSAQSTVEQLFEGYRLAMRDPELAEMNRQAIKDHLTNRHGFSLSEADEVTIAHVVTVFALYGPSLTYNSNMEGLSIGGGNNVQYSEIMSLRDAEGGNRSFLASEETYGYIKDMHERNLIVPIVGDFGGPKALRAVGQYLKDHQATVGMFYLSNVEQYLFQLRANAVNGGAANFYGNVATLPLDASSTFVRSGNNQNFTGRGGLTPMMSSMIEVLEQFGEGRVKSHLDVLSLSVP